eukprot:gnl/TRDRNA2_/TRDRNA2_60119_c0_seq1.p1 gnl/TRDRNA2_/TRDRNA2_60119_c0~~gnl/TRDRNA2_/TRDRNA2_60119_c0_seq1.p1  ORF type:complete len:328 (-),score=42.01 gnl/TRDRNA2_/TRDRNA2_60119_c0_seq1:60-1043(-)
MWFWKGRSDSDDSAHSTQDVPAVSTACSSTESYIGGCQSYDDRIGSRPRIKARRSVPSSASDFSSDASSECPDGLDVESFPRFAPLLEMCQDYSQFTGHRFRRKSFDGIVPRPDSRSVVGSTHEGLAPLYAKVKAAASISEFQQRLLDREAGLVEEFHTAFRICMLESVRNDMIMTLKSLDMWGDDPSKPSEGVPDTDCSWEDVSAPLDVIAQRLFNDHVRRNSNRVRCLRRRAETASFVVDFAYEVGYPLPEMSETHLMMLDEFNRTASEWRRRLDERAQSTNSVGVLSLFGHLNAVPEETSAGKNAIEIACEIAERQKAESLVCG